MHVRYFLLKEYAPLLYGWACFQVMAQRAVQKKAYCPPSTVRVQYVFLQTGKFLWENFWVDLNEHKRRLSMFVGKFRTITRPGTLVLFFLKSISEENECLRGVNMKWNQQDQANTALKTEKKMNQKLYNKRFINLVCSVCTRKYLRFFRSDLAPSLLCLYENLMQILSCTDLALG